MPTDKLAALVDQFAYKFNVDVLSGWEAGIQSARAQAPEHLTGARWSDWMVGREAARTYLATRRTFFTGYTPDGKTVEVVRKGWVARGPVVSQLERKGVTGDVFVTYIDASKTNSPRSVTCCI